MTGVVGNVGTIGIVAIGRNEGEQLRACLTSALRDATHVVYVDSGSTDDSVAMARSLGVEVVQLDLSIPFTAARSRNTGFEKLIEIAPSVEFVQFVDGDCEIVQGWIGRAVEEMLNNTKAGVVCGRRRERFPRASIYNTLCDIEWNTPVGQAMACGGDALIRTQTFQEVGGYNVSMIAGEEPEMCLRIRRYAAMQVWRIDAEMTLHDAAMTKLSQWWKRTVRSGHAYAEGFAMHGKELKYNYRQTQSIWLWGFFIPLGIVGSAIDVAILPKQQWWQPASVLMLIVLGYSVVLYRVNRFARTRGLNRRDTMLYSFSVILGKFPQMIGMLTYRLSRLRGKQSVLIEYKTAAHSGS